MGCCVCYLIWHNECNKICTPCKSITDKVFYCCKINEFFYHCDYGVIPKSSSDGANSIGTAFRGNKTIRKFHEFQYFRLSSIAGSAFDDSGISEITFPTTLRTVWENAFIRCYNLTSMVLNEGVTSTGNQWLWGDRNITLIDLPTTIRTLSGYGIHTYASANQKKYTVIRRAVTPPSLGSNGYLTNLTAVYVPDESVNAYNTATTWSGIASKIKPLSEYTG